MTSSIAHDTARRSGFWETFDRGRLGCCYDGSGLRVDFSIYSAIVHVQSLLTSGHMDLYVALPLTAQHSCTDGRSAALAAPTGAHTPFLKLFIQLWNFCGGGRP